MINGFRRRSRRRRAEPGQIQLGFGEGSGEGLGGFGAESGQVRFNRICGYLTHGNPAEVFPALGFAAHLNMICKNKTLWLLGIPPKPIFFVKQSVGISEHHA
jgi:hypothetical protein